MTASPAVYWTLRARRAPLPQGVAGGAVLERGDDGRWRGHP
jgi:hypothetical protein